MPDLVARQTGPSLTRRRFLQGTGAVGVSAFLAACVGSTDQTSPTPAATAQPTAQPTAPPTPTPGPTGTPKAITGPLEFANWTAYIDTANGHSATLDGFQAKYSIKVDYEEKIDDNASFEKTIEPALVAGLSTGWDLVVLTDWMAGQLISKSWIEAIDQSNVPNCVANLRPPLKGIPWDPNNDYHYPWQSGMTGIGYSVKGMAEAKMPAPTKLADLWNIDPNKVTFLTESRDTYGLGLLKLGIDPDPAKVTADDFHSVTTDMQPLVDKGLRFTGNSYVQDFGQKKVWAAMVWSGDLSQSGDPDQQFVFPEEGTMIWTDNMMIPKGAKNKYTAELMMNYVYDPQVAAQIASFVGYVTPVQGAADVIKKSNPAAANNPLLFPTPDIVAKQHNFQYLSADLTKALDDEYSTLSGQ
jgi:spermidine/putrescine transport system substrate-binding protein